jgi:single stranded DNA-binding protein
MKSITFDGRIGANGAEVRTTKGGRPYVRFSVANNSYANGQEKTEWFDITSYDPFVIENRVKYLTKGTYVIITGTPNTEVNVDRTGKVWLNQYVTANSIDTPAFRKKDDDSTTTQGTSTTNDNLSTFTATTQQTITKTVEAPQVAAPMPASVGVGVSSDADDDLPF